jgi:hypothetical protein
VRNGLSSFPRRAYRLDHVAGNEQGFVVFAGNNANLPALKLIGLKFPAGRGLRFFIIVPNAIKAIKQLTVKRANPLRITRSRP